MICPTFEVFVEILIIIRERHNIAAHYLETKFEVDFIEFIFDEFTKI